MERLSACAGVAIVKRHFPFSIAYHLAEQLIKSAKEVKKKIPCVPTDKIPENTSFPCSAIDFHILYGSSSIELDKIREQLKPELNTQLFNRPYIVSKDLSQGNVESLDYIPGRYFLGHLHQKLGKYLNVKSAIAQSHLIITNATVAINDSPSRPIPLCLFSEKLDGGLSKGKGVYNRFQEVEPKGIQLKGERGGYIGQFDVNGSTLPSYQTVKLQVNTHNTIDDNFQRPSPETGGAVYSYQAIPSNTTFKAELRLPKSIKEYLDQQSPNWIETLNSNLRIGQSKKDQYGLVSIKTSPPNELQLSKAIEDNQPLYVWLLSDVLLRDQRLKPTTDPDVFKQELETQLEITLKERPSNDNELLSLMARSPLVASFARSRRTESWQVRWGLPRPSMLGLQAGSCFVYEITGEKPTPEKLAAIEAKGIGERQVEGYGQICFNDPLLMKELSKRDRKETESNPNSPKPHFIPASDSSFDYARIIEIAAWREAIQNQALSLAADALTRTRILGITIEEEKSYPSMSQLGGLRSNFRRLKSLSDQTQVTSWITALENVPNRREKWDKTENGLQKIRELVTNPQIIWQELNIVSQDQLIPSSKSQLTVDPPLRQAQGNTFAPLSKGGWGDLNATPIVQNDITMTVGGRNELKQILWAEAVRTLVDAIIRAHKRDLEKVQGKKTEENGKVA